MIVSLLLGLAMAAGMDSGGPLLRWRRARS
jgi:hypothetical protein